MNSVNMEKILSVVCLCFLFSTHFAGAATTANVTLQGRILSSTCAVDINGLSDATVVLKKTPVSEFDAKGMMIEGAPFTLNFKGCSDNGDGYVHVTLTPNSGVSPKDLSVMLPTSGSTKNVGFALTSDNTGSTALIFGGANSSAAQKWKLDTAGTATGELKVFYKSLDMPVQAGTISTSMVVSIVYY